MRTGIAAFTLVVVLTGFVAFADAQAPKPNILVLWGDDIGQSNISAYTKGVMLGVLDELGIANNTIVFYSTDNGPHMNTWPDGGMTPFRSEKNSNWEGAYRVPAMVRWPGRIKPGSVSNEIVSHLDWLPTFVAAAGDPDIKGKLLKGHAVGSRTYKVHLDGSR